MDDFRAIICENERMRSVLREVEWSLMLGQEPYLEQGCPYCYAGISKWHTPDCALAAALTGESP